MHPFLLALLLLACSAVVVLPARRAGGLFRDRLSLVLALAGVLAGITGTMLALGEPAGAWSWRTPWSLPGAAISLSIDGIAAAFLLPSLTLFAAASLYGCGYWPLADHPGTGAWIRSFSGLLAVAVCLLLTSANAVLFLAAWEVMALSAYFLVATERADKDEARTASFLYLITTHTGTLALFGVFVLACPGNGLMPLPPAGSLDGGSASATAIFLLALLGFGLKAGLLPLHFWLPPAHAAAPSHVSALMSGALIKMGIYGLIRVTGFFHSIPPWWGWTVLVLGLASSLLGVILALAQHDLKRLLAFHSVENIGIILMGLGTALLGVSHGQPPLMALGLAGALLHTINHGLFKGLLFLAAGAMIQAAGTRRIDRMGGMLRGLPRTGIFFLGGAAAICGLPPLNGFVSEWLVGLGLLHAPVHRLPGLAPTLFAIPGLAMTGALALLCFAKVFGIAFLGAPRQEAPIPCEAHPAMQAGMALLLAVCLWIGLAPSTVLPLLARGIAAWTPVAAGSAPILLSTLAPAGWLSVAALLLLFLLAPVLLFQLRRPPAPQGPTWGCGFRFPILRAQYTASSFVQLLLDGLGWLLRTETARDTPATLFWKTSSWRTHTPDAILDRALAPGCRWFAGVAESLRHLLQHGVIGRYLLLTALALCALLLLALASF